MRFAESCGGGGGEVCRGGGGREKRKVIIIHIQHKAAGYIENRGGR